MVMDYAVTQFILAKKAKQLREHTLYEYQLVLNKLAGFLGVEVELEKITVNLLREFFVGQDGTKKTIKNRYMALSSFFNFLVREDVLFKNPLANVECPNGESRQIIPYTRHEIEALLKCIWRSRPYVQKGKRTSNRTMRPLRDRAIIVVLLDTGIRANELCQLKVIDFANDHLHIVFGKNDKEREVPLCPMTRRAIQEYLKHERAGVMPTDRLFTTFDDKPLDRNSALRIMRRIARRAGVAQPGLHRFRHTFAITFLRNGGDIYSLKAILGHESLDMVERYLAISSTDIDGAHKRASPVKRWKLIGRNDGQSSK
jgi:site-specific recombinase XerD